MKNLYAGFFIYLISIVLFAQQTPIDDNSAITLDGVQNCDTEISFTTLYYGNQTITVDSVATDTAWLKDCTRGGGIETVNLNGSFSWEDPQPINLDDNVPGAEDAHWGTEKVCDFYFNKYGLNSFDGIGAKMRTCINFGPTHVNGALFFGTGTAIDLFGECANEVQQLIQDWYAVGGWPDTYTRDLDNGIRIIKIISKQVASREKMIVR